MLISSQKERLRCDAVRGSREGKRKWDRWGFRRTHQNTLLLAGSSVVFPFRPSPQLAARRSALIDDRIWELTWHTLCRLLRPPSLSSYTRYLEWLLLLSNLSPPLHSLWWTGTKTRVINTVKCGESHVWLRRSWGGRCRGRAVPVLPSTPTSARCWWSFRALIDECIHACALGFPDGMWVSSERKLISCKDTRVMNMEVFSFFSERGGEKSW